MSETLTKLPATVRTSTCERYDVRAGYGWAVILLAEAGGVLSILSDYGRWGYCWPQHGRATFKHFLLEMDGSRDYLIRKLGGAETDFDFDASVRQLKVALGHAYRDRRRVYYAGGRSEVFDLAKCRAALRQVDELEDTRSADDFARQVWDRGGLGVIEDFDGIIVKRDSGELCGFLERLWPHFVGQLRREVGGHG